MVETRSCRNCGKLMRIEQHHACAWCGEPPHQPGSGAIFGFGVMLIFVLTVAAVTLWLL